MTANNVFTQYAFHWNIRRNLTAKQFVVKEFIVALLGALVIAFSVPAAAEDDNVRAMMNATQLTNVLHAVAPERLLFIVDRIAKNEIQRAAPDQPVWFLESISGTILYYQGKPEFTAKPAAQLVDDAGNRFGLRGLELSKASRGGWVNVQLGGANYRAYCASKYPTVVCSLVPRPLSKPGE